MPWRGICSLLENYIQIKGMEIERLRANVLTDQINETSRQDIYKCLHTMNFEFHLC